jgi:hypothetical protein
MDSCKSCKYYNKFNNYCEVWKNYLQNPDSVCNNYELSADIKKCCSNCKFYKTDGQCKAWFEDIEAVTGLSNADVASCEYFDQKEVIMEEKFGKNPTGDNFPNYNALHLRLSINQERHSMIEKLILAEQGCITKDDIMDMKIDIELYNKNCRKELIKERYKHKE